MIAFWLAALAMALVAIAALAGPLLRRRKGRTRDDEALLSVYRERDAELLREHAQGNIDDAELAEAREELERELLDATDGAVRPADTGSAGRSLGTFAAVALVVPLSAALVYAVSGRPGLVGDGAATGLSPAQIERFRDMGPEQRIRRLEPLVAENPGATRGLVLLAQAYRATGRYGDAVDAYARVRARSDEDDPWLLARQAEALLLANGRRFSASVERLVEQALALDDSNPLALMLAGHAAMARGDNAQAVTYWQRLAADLPPESDNSALLDRLIARARDGAGGGNGTAAPGSGSAAAGNAGAADPGAEGQAAVAVRVRIADALAGRAPADTPVFVFARAAGDAGGGPPLAVARTTVGALPARIRLTDDSAMTTSARLSQAERVEITARASLSGGVTARDGDLQGTSGPVAVGADAEITIDRTVGANGAAASTGGDDGGTPQVAVSLRLAPGLADAAPADTPVFVFAREVGGNGGGPPLAVARTSVDALPARIRLSDANAMTSQRRLSQAARVRVTARVAISGGVRPQSGDLEGTSDAIPVGPSAGTELVIDRRIP